LLTLAVGTPLILLFAAVRGDSRAFMRLLKTVGVLAVAGAIVITPVLIMQPQVIGAMEEVVDTTLSKGDSESYTERTGLDAAALDTVGLTYGLGVGWGGFRASSLVPGLLANAGVFGMAMALWLFARVARLVSRVTAAAPHHPGRIVVEGFSAALAGQVAAALLSAPTIGSLAFYLQLGCVVGAAARMSMEPSARTGLALAGVTREHAA